MKILDKILFFIIIIISSCQSIKIDSVSRESEAVFFEENYEVDLPYINDIEYTEIKTSSSTISPQIFPIKNSNKLPLLSYDLINTPWYSRPINSISKIEYSLPPLVVAEDIDIIDSDPTIINKPVVTKPVVTKPVVTKPVVTKPVVTKPVVTKPVVTKPVVTKPVVLLLDDIEVFSGKSFTVEMDQSGWLYEHELDYLQFQNKFYTNNKVLFEFFASQTGTYEIEFSKYTDNGVEFSRVNVHVHNEPLDSEDINDNNSLIIVPDSILESISEKTRLETALKNIETNKNPDEVYYKLGIIYFDEGLIKKSKEYFEYVYDNYPLSIYYEDAKDKMDYIINNFLKRR